MKAKTCFRLLITFNVLLALVSCEKTKKPVADFSADKTTINVGETVQFTDLSTNDPTGYAWKFDGGTPNTSTAQNPTVQYNTQGTYTVILNASNDGGGDSEVKEGYITVVEANTDITFNNMTYTEINITIEGKSKSVDPASSVTFYDIEGDQVAYYADTYGSTSTGEQIGEYIFWDNVLQLSGGPLDINLNIDASYFFLFITNNGYEDLSPITVNVGLSSEITEDIYIPADDVKYRIGYFQAVSGAQIFAYLVYDSYYYIFWTEGLDFYFPNTANQSIHLINTYKKKSARTDNPYSLLTDSQITLPLRDYPSEKILSGKNAIDVSQSNK